MSKERIDKLNCSVFLCVCACILLMVVWISGSIVVTKKINSLIDKVFDKYEFDIVIRKMD